MIFSWLVRVVISGLDNVFAVFSHDYVGSAGLGEPVGAVVAESVARCSVSTERIPPVHKQRLSTGQSDKVG